jgi:flagellar biosynthetic protein FlhB
MSAPSVARHGIQAGTDASRTKPGPAARERTYAPIIHLQWFAAEDEGRTEEASEYKIRKAREEGRVAKSQDLVQSLGLLLPFATLIVFAPYLWRVLAEMTGYFISIATEVDPTTDGGKIAQAFFSYFLALSWPFGVAAVISAVFSNVVQVGFLFTTKPLVPDFSKVVPKPGKLLKNLFSIEGLFNFAKAIVKMGLIAAVAWLNVSADFPKLVGLFEIGFMESLDAFAALATRIVVECALLMLALSIPDYMFQRRQYMESLKMTKQEVKEERKMYEGDPMVKNRLKQRMRELLTRNMVQNVPKADVVVTNPTHYAVALEWNRETMSAPSVTAKGADEIARRIREIAAESGVPIMENKPLARALYAEVEIGESVPEKYYQVIATILAHVYTMRGNASGSGKGRSA